MRGRDLVFAVGLLGLFGLGILVAEDRGRSTETDRPLLASEHGVRDTLATLTGSPPEAPSVRELFDGTGRNPGSAAHPNAPGRVRTDAPAQHELGVADEDTPGFPNREAYLRPDPIPEIDDSFVDTIRMSDDSRADDFPVIVSNPANRDEVWMAWVSYSGRRDQIRLSRRDPATGRWATWNPVPGVTGDVWRPSMCFDSESRLWLIWAQQRPFEANFDLFGRWFDGGRWGPLEPLASSGGGDFNHDVVRGPDGTMHLVWQSFRDGRSDIFYSSYDGGDWSPEVQVSQSPGNDWCPSVAVDSSGMVFVTWDTYDGDSYDVVLRSIVKGLPGKTRPIADSRRFEARSSVAVDTRNRVWVAYEVGEYGWGKDQGMLVDRSRTPGSMLNMERTVQVAVLDAELRWARPEPADLFPPRHWKINVKEVQQHLSHPELVIDDAGGIYLVVRKLEYDGGTAEYWRPYLLEMTARGWLEPARLPYSRGRLSMFCSATSASDRGLWLAWPRDNHPTFSAWHVLPEETMFENVYAARYEPKGSGGMLAGEYRDPGFTDRPAGHADERADVARIRQWRTRVGDEDLGILRGDLHRHTEFSMDIRGIPDGSVLDFYRYMLDAAAMDFGMIADHQYGSDREYWWWLEEKLADLFFDPRGFTPLFGYERSIRYPQGHRNIVHATRGVPPVPFFQTSDIGLRYHTAAGSVLEDDARLLFEEIRSSGGITIPHTSATGMGTDWSDNDPDVEPLVEIYQGDRHSYEASGAPLTDTTGVFGAREQGYVSNAWEKGYRLGVVASSDHLSTHISYAMVWTADSDRVSILEAMRNRRTYAATDNIVLEFWIGDRFMGDELTARAVMPIRIRAVGTAPFADIQIIRNNRSIYRNSSASPDVELTYQDLHPAPGTSFYYARLVQVDGQTAWSSPIWVTLPGS
jgi:hypothetical protein